jgi:hypothetical protein
MDDFASEDPPSGQPTPSEQSPSPSEQPTPSAPDNTPVAYILDMSGTASVTDISGHTISVSKGLSLVSRDTVTTGAGSWANLEFTSGWRILMEENTTLQVGVFTLGGGKIWVNTDKSLELSTPNATLSVRGTVFSVRYAGGVTYLTVFGGVVNINGTDITAGFAAEISDSGGLTTRSVTSGDYNTDAGGGELDGWLGGATPPPSTTLTEFFYSDLSGEFIWEDDIWGHKGALGAYLVNFRLSGDYAGVRDVKITGVTTGVVTNTFINSNLAVVEEWKKTWGGGPAGAFNGAVSDYVPLYLDDIGQTINIVLMAVDSNCNALGYVVVPVSIPQVVYPPPSRR